MVSPLVRVLLLCVCVCLLRFRFRSSFSPEEKTFVWNLLKTLSLIPQYPQDERHGERESESEQVLSCFLSEFSIKLWLCSFRE